MSLIGKRNLFCNFISVICNVKGQIVILVKEMGKNKQAKKARYLHIKTEYFTIQSDRKLPSQVTDSHFVLLLRHNIAESWGSRAEVLTANMKLQPPICPPSSACLRARPSTRACAYVCVCASTARGHAANRKKSSLSKQCWKTRSTSKTADEPNELRTISFFFF